MGKYYAKVVSQVINKIEDRLEIVEAYIIRVFKHAERKRHGALT